MLSPWLKGREDSVVCQSVGSSIRRWWGAAPNPLCLPSKTFSWKLAELPKNFEASGAQGHALVPVSTDLNCHDQHKVLLASLVNESCPDQLAALQVTVAWQHPREQVPGL